MTSGRVVGWYLACLVAVWGVAFASVELFGIRAQGDPRLPFRFERAFEGFFRYDGGWYVGIAKSGYSYTPGQQSNIAFFPGYPLAIRGATWLIRDAVNAGMLISIVSGCGALVLVARWMKSRSMSTEAVVCGLLVTMLYPYSWYLYGVVYSDALFLLATVAAVLAVDAGRPLLAGGLGIVATLDRPTGIAVALGLVVMVAERRGALVHDPAIGPSFVRRFKVPNVVRLNAFRLRDGWILLGFGGLAAYMGYLSYRFDDALAFVTVQRAWNQDPGWATLWKRQYWWEVTHFVHRSLVLTTTFQAALLAIAALTVPFVARRFGWGLATIQIVLVAMPTVGTSVFQGGGRYLIALFPLHAMLGEWLSKRSRRTRLGYFTASSATLVVLTAGFAHGVYLS